jgi:hypothetical protein
MKYNRIPQHRETYAEYLHNFGIMNNSAILLGQLVCSTLTDGSYSGVYYMFNPLKSRAYHGKWHGSESWCCWDRQVMHYGQILASERGDSVEDKYDYMKNNGGFPSWFGLPRLRVGSPIPKPSLDKIEKRFIVKDPICLNKMHNRRHKQVKGCGRLPLPVRRKLETELLTTLKSENICEDDPDAQPSHHQQPFNPHQPCFTYIDPHIFVSNDGVNWEENNDEIAAHSYKFVSIHPSRPIGFTFISRLWGKSVVLACCTVTGRSVQCKL